MYSVPEEPPYICIRELANSGKVWPDGWYSSKFRLIFSIFFLIFFLNISFQSGSDRRCQPYVTQCLGHCFCSVPLALSWYLRPSNQHERCFKNNHVSFSSLLQSRPSKHGERLLLTPEFVTTLFTSSWETEDSKLLYTGSASADNLYVFVWVLPTVSNLQRIK